MKIKKLNEMNDSTEIINKVGNFSKKDMNDFEGWNKCVNIVSKYIDIKYMQMYNSFGVYNFVDDYKESNWWILNFENTKFAIEFNSREGTWIHIYLPEEEFYYSDNTKQKVQRFYNQLLKQL
jgi:hypothetical protein